MGDIVSLQEIIIEASGGKIRGSTGHLINYMHIETLSFPQHTLVNLYVDLRCLRVRGYLR